MARVRSVTEDDAERWLEMRVALWPDGSPAEHRTEIEQFLAGKTAGRPAEVLIAETTSGDPEGFIELAVRPYAEGCRTDRVAYVEGWFVRPDARRRGVGAALIKAAEAWGRARGCTELASDTEPNNEASIAAHQAVGFRDTGVVRCFYKKL